MGLTFDFEVSLGSSGYSPFGPQIYPIKNKDYFKYFYKNKTMYIDKFYK